MKTIKIQVPEDYCNECIFFQSWVPYEVGPCFRQYYCKRLKCYLKVDHKKVHKDNFDREYKALPDKNC